MENTISYTKSTEIETFIDGIYICADVVIAYDAIAENADHWDESHIDNLTLRNNTSIVSNINLCCCCDEEGCSQEIEKNDAFYKDASYQLLEWLFETTEGNDCIAEIVKDAMNQ